MGSLSLNKTDKDGAVTGTMELDIRVYPIAEPKGNAKAYASIGIEGMFGAHGISVVEGKNGLFVSMPQTKDSSGEYRDIFHPVTSDGRKEINKAVLAEYAIALESLEVKKQPVAEQLQEAKAAKGQPSQAKGAKTAEKSAGKDAAKSSAKKADVDR